MEYSIKILPTKNGIERYYEIDIDETIYLTLHYEKGVEAIWKSLVSQAKQYFDLVHEVHPSSGSGICWNTLIFDNGSGIENGLVLTHNYDDSSVDVVLRIPYSEKAVIRFIETVPEISGCCRFFSKLMKEALDEVDLNYYGSTDSNL